MKNLNSDLCAYLFKFQTKKEIQLVIHKQTPEFVLGEIEGQGKSCLIGISKIWLNI